MPILRTLFGAKHRPGRNGTPDLSLKLAAVIEKPRYDLTLFKVHFGNLTLKAYTKGEHALRFEAVVCWTALDIHTSRHSLCRRSVDNSIGRERSWATTTCTSALLRLTRVAEGKPTRTQAR